MKNFLILCILLLVFCTSCQKNIQLDEKSHNQFHRINFSVTKIDSISWGYLIEGKSEKYDSILVISPKINKKLDCKNFLKVGESYTMKLKFESYYGEIDGFTFEGKDYSTNYVVSYKSKNLKGLCIN